MAAAIWAAEAADTCSVRLTAICQKKHSVRGVHVERPAFVSYLDRVTESTL